MAKFLSSWGLRPRTRCFKPFTERSCANRGCAFVVTLAATICGLVLGTFAGRRTAYAQRCLTIFWIPYWRPFAAAGNYRCSVCRTEFVPRMFAVWLALLPRMVRSIYSMGMTNWKKSTLSPPVWMAHQREYSLVCCDAKHHRRAGHRDHRALSMAILDIAALGFLDLGDNSPRLNGERCSVMRWN